jgi:hypothetical protein
MTGEERIMNYPAGYTINLHNAQQGHTAWNALWPEIKAHLMAGHQLAVTIKPQTRSSAANALLHATLTDIADQLQWAGAKQDVEVWKRLLTAAWLRARGESVAILPAIDGHGIDVVFRRTSELTRAECSELQEFCFAWGVEQGVKFKAPDRQDA